MKTPRLALTRTEPTQAHTHSPTLAKRFMLDKWDINAVCPDFRHDVQTDLMLGGPMERSGHTFAKKILFL